MTETKKLLDLDPEVEQQIIKSIEEYRGQGPVLGSALGALIVGQHYGWRVLKMFHNQSTYSKYEKILGIKFAELCDERTKLSRKSIGLAVADKICSFWAVVRGEVKVENKGMLTDADA